jgi:hypothetical protein
LCADSREVKSIKLEKFFPNLQKKTAPEDEPGFFYSGYLTSEFLDKRVNNSRTGFDFSDYTQVEPEGKDFEKDLLEAAKSSIYVYLKKYIDDINEKKKRFIKNFVNHKKPQYRVLLNRRPDVYDMIKPDLSDEELELALHKQVLIWDKEVM